MADTLGILAGASVELVIFGIASAVLYRIFGRASFLPNRHHLMPFTRGVVLKGDTVEKVLDSGYRWLAPGRTLVAVDTRPKPFQIAVREAITADNGAVRVAFGGEYKIYDPAAYVRESSDAFGTMYIALEKIIQSAASDFDLETILNEPGVLADRVRELVEPRAAQLGLKITSLEVSNIVSAGWVLKPTEQ